MSTQAYLTREQVAERLGLTPKTLANWKAIGKGPKCIRLAGGRVRYASEDCLAWEEAQKTGT